MKDAAGPQSVVVIGKTFTIEYVEKVDDDDNSGECDDAAQIIKVNRKQHAESIKDTLLHEVIHAVERQLDLRMKEKQVHALAVGMLQVLRENPTFVAFLTAQARKRGR
jgi:hypothetical protein